ncbi:ankyrin repeat-containing domain protein [Aspergillus spectabilis]
MGQHLTIAITGQIGPAIASPQDAHHRLHIAASEGSPELVTLLLDAGADTSAIDSLLGQTPLHIAIIRQHTNVVRQLLDAGAPLTVADWAFRTPIHRAVEVRNLHILRLLLDELDKKSLHDRSITDAPDPFVKWLPQKHADGLTTYWNGGSALHDAAIQGDEDVIEFIYFRQPDIQSLDLYGRTALDYLPHVRPALHNKILERWQQNLETDPTQRFWALTRSVIILSNNILLSHHGSSECDFYLYALGKCLLYLGNEQAAKTVFALQGEHRDHENARYITVKCKRCRQNPTVAGGRWVCKKCPEVDLCARCASHYADFLIASKTCVAHQMLKVRVEDQNGIEFDGVDRSSSKQGWLEGLIKLYSA